MDTSAVVAIDLHDRLYVEETRTEGIDEDPEREVFIESQVYQISKGTSANNDKTLILDRGLSIEDEAQVVCYQVDDSPADGPYIYESTTKGLSCVNSLGWTLRNRWCRPQQQVQVWEGKRNARTRPFVLDFIGRWIYWVMDDTLCCCPMLGCLRDDDQGSWIEPPVEREVDNDPADADRVMQFLRQESEG